jgi:hypothetical protein
MTLLDRARYELEIEDRFTGPGLDRRIWMPAYLPHWSSFEQASARYDVGDGRLRLRIDADQAPWCPEYDGQLRVSSLQTGSFAGPLGSGIGQHRFRDGIVVREPHSPTALYTPTFGLFEARLRALHDPADMVAFWMIGYEDQPERSAEICIVEIFGRDVESSTSTRVGVGVHPHHDPAVSDDFERVPLAIDVSEAHDYAAVWAPDHIAFFVDEILVKTVHQSIDYPMQLMLGIYEFVEAEWPPSPAHAYPKAFEVEWFRGYRPMTGPGARPPEPHPGRTA